MECIVEYTDEFGAWWDTLSDAQQTKIDSYVTLLRKHGVQLGYPHSSAIKGSRHGQMRELRVQSGGKPLRILYAFDPRRMAILLIGGDKTGDDRFYETIVAVADRLYDEHLVVLKKEGLLP